MNLTFIALVSHDDLLPLLAIAGALKGAGHRVRLLSSAEHAALAETFGIEVAPLSDDVRPNATLTRFERGEISVAELMRRYFDRHAAAWAAQGADACRNSDFVIGTGLSTY